MSISPAILRCREEQKSAAALLLAGHPEQEGLTRCIEDWFAEELLLEEREHEQEKQ